uniref:hypothetical protein n=1 Tax=Sphingomonas bacterium TaxID=1895847 RepID=UPI00157562F8
MTCPTILLQPIIRVTEAEPYGTVTTHWDEPATHYALVMLGGGDVRVADFDEDGRPTDKRCDLRLRIADAIVDFAGLGAEAREAIASAAIHPAGGQ